MLYINKPLAYDSLFHWHNDSEHLQIGTTSLLVKVNTVFSSDVALSLWLQLLLFTGCVVDTAVFLWQWLLMQCYCQMILSFCLLCVYIRMTFMLWPVGSMQNLQKINKLCIAFVNNVQRRHLLEFIISLSELSWAFVTERTINAFLFWSMSTFRKLALQTLSTG